MRDEAFADFMYNYREERGLTQKDLAKISGVNASTISRIESGVVYPDKETILKIAAGYEIDPEELLAKSKYASVPEAFVIMARKTGNLSDEEKRAVYKLLDRTIDKVLAKLGKERDDGD